MTDRRLKIKLTTSFPQLSIIRQTQQLKGIWGKCHFFINKNVEKCDYWFVYENLKKPETTICPKENIIFITGEPQSLRKYNRKFLSQFATIITSHENIKHPNIINSQTSLPWLVGVKYDQKTNSWDKKSVMSYDQFKKAHSPKKRLISVIVSNRDNTEGHRKRMNLIKELKKHFQNDLDVFGRGIKEISDKWDGLAPYKYSLAIENSSHNDYWTEKLSDTFLAGSYPFYYGCRNLSKYFPKGSYTLIDINNIKKSISIIEDSIKNNVYEKSISKINEAKELVLDKYNLFALICDYCHENFKTSPAQKIVLKPEKTKKAMHDQIAKYSVVKLIKDKIVSSK